MQPQSRNASVVQVIENPDRNDSCWLCQRDRKVIMFLLTFRLDDKLDTVILMAPSSRGQSEILLMNVQVFWLLHSCLFIVLQDALLSVLGRIGNRDCQWQHQQSTAWTTELQWTPSWSKWLHREISHDVMKLAHHRKFGWMKSTECSHNVVARCWQSRLTEH